MISLAIFFHTALAQEENLKLEAAPCKTIPLVPGEAKVSIPYDRMCSNPSSAIRSL